jgi:TolB-like protein
MDVFTPMKNRTRHIYTIILGGLAWLLMGHVGWSLAETPSKIAIVPFKINATEHFSFLQEGLTDMLTSRLAWQGRMVVIDKHKTQEGLKEISGNIDEKKARDIGEALGAHYVLFGSLTIIGDNISIDGKLIDIENQSHPATIYNQSTGIDTVMPTINAFAMEINRHIFGGDVTAPKESPPLQTPTTSDIRTHPERLLENDQKAGVKK